MNASEKAVIKTIINNLKSSTKTDWTSGGLDQWSDWAKKMRTVIHSSSNILESLMDVEETVTPKELERYRAALSEGKEKSQVKPYKETTPPPPPPAPVPKDLGHFDA